MRIPLTEVRGAGRESRRPLLFFIAVGLVVAALSAPAGVPPSLAQPGGTWRRHVCLDCVYDVVATDDALWVATISGGVIRYDRRSDASRRYTTADGLAGDGSGKMAVGPDGDLWMINYVGLISGPMAGISHFDGVRWTSHTLATGLPDARVHDIAVGPHGTVWVSTSLGPAHYDGVRWRLYTTADGLPSVPVHAVAVGLNGEAWASTDQGLARFDGARWSVVPHDNVPQGLVFNALAVAPDGDVWCGYKMEYGVVAFHPKGFPDGSHWTVHPFNGLPPLGPSTSVIDTSTKRIKVDHDGGVWVAGAAPSPRTDLRMQVAHLDDQGWKVTDHPTPNWPSSIDVSPDGQVWIGHPSAGVRHWDGRAWRSILQNSGPTNQIAFAITTDPGDQVWTGFFPIKDDDNLVNRFDGARWTRYSSADGMLKGGVLGVMQQSIDADTRGNVWVGVDRVGIAWFDGRVWSSKAIGDLFPPETSIRAVAGDDHGGVWVATDAGALHYDGRAWQRYSSADGLASDHVLAVAVDSRGGGERVWFGTDNGVSSWDGARWTTYTSSDGLGTNSIKAIAVDTVHDAIWFASGQWFGSGPAANGGLTRYDGRSWRVYGKADGLPADDFWTIEVAPNGDLWAVGQDDIQSPGITRFDGTRWTTYTTADGLLHDDPFDVAIDSKGTVWVATMAGVSEFHPAAVPVPAASPTPVPGPTVEAGLCICQLARQAAPRAAIDAAVADPASVAGWRQPLDPNKPVGRFNPLRECLSLQRASVPYHPLFNPLAWRAGCP
jgi:ligand-binding sensor domain-containing protein